VIAQEIALQHPDRVAGLILGATTPGATAAVPADGPTFAFFQRRLQMPAEEAVRASIPHNYSDQTRAEHREGISENIRERLRFPIEARRIPHNSPPHSGTTPMIGSRESPRPHSWSTASRT
jgi:pimeloyl-ACP methyl ester carboxylesterase